MKTAYDIIIRPVITEQSMEATELKKYVFLVAESANKTEIKGAIEAIFDGVKVESVNTMRIVTDNVNGNVTIAYIIVKMGTGGSVCDNSGQGGILARVDVDTGRISTPATDDYFHVYDTHPDTGIPLVGYQLPMVPEAIAMAKEAAQVFPQVGHVGWDMAVTPDGPAIIEGNNFPGTDLCQLAPLWPEKTGLWPYYKNILHLK